MVSTSDDILLDSVLPVRLTGSVTGSVGMTIIARNFPAPLGSLCEIRQSTGQLLRAEVIGFRQRETLLSAYGEPHGLAAGDAITLVSTSPSIHVGPNLQGRVINAFGEPIDGLGPMVLPYRRSIYAPAPDPMTRPLIGKPLPTCVRAIDSFLTIAQGQRMGIFAGSGVGKSTLLGMITRYCQADVIVLGMIGERGREVREFLEKSLGPEGTKRSVVVCATSNEPAHVRVRAAMVATSIAEYFRDHNKNVMLMVDSLTRLALAQREIGLAVGEPPATKGYPPSVFALLPRVIERTGLSELGSITALYTVLVEGDDENEIVADTVRGLIDGHIWLSRKLANQGQFPAIDLLKSLSRTMGEVCSPEHMNNVHKLRRLLATYADKEDMIQMGAYVQNSNPEIEMAIKVQQQIREQLRQRVDDPTNFADSQALITAIANQASIAAKK